MNTKFTRRKFLKSAGAGAALITLANAPGCERAEPAPPAPPKLARGRRSPVAQSGDVWAFRSRPDLGPPTIEVRTQARNAAPGYIFIAPKKGVGQYGPMIVDDRGQLVWFRSVQSEGAYAMGFKVQSYRGEPVITWAEGRVVSGHGLDEYVILDSSYREIIRVRAGDGYTGDHHEFLITPQDTALLTIYDTMPADLSVVGGPRDALVWDAIAQEIVIETGEVLFEWHSVDHVGLEESFTKPSQDPAKPFCHFHINSIEVDYDGNLLISSRNTWTVYKIDRETGEIMWRLDGKSSDFEMGPGTRTRYQHDVRRQPDGTITIFDNGGMHVDDQSRAVVLELDERAMSATLVREYTHPEKLLVATQGNVQVLPNGNVFMGWGSEPVFSEFGRDGELLFSAGFPPEDESYRAYRFEWSGRPADAPALAAERESDEKVTLYASWNGSTEVDSWQLLTGSAPGRMTPVGSVPHDGFETAITVRTIEPYVGVEARDHSDRRLGASEPVEVT